MTALVLGLVTASAKSSFDAVDKAMKRTANEILALDRVHKLSQNSRVSAESLESTVALSDRQSMPNGWTMGGGLRDAASLSLCASRRFAG